MPTLGLALIVKDEAKELKRLFESFTTYTEDGKSLTPFDQIVVVTEDEEVKKIAKTHGAKVYTSYKWKKDFADARNFSFSKITTDYVMWLDADDELVGHEAIPEILEHMETHGIVWGQLKYDYDRSVTGLGMADQWKPRIIKRDGQNIWKKAVHENLERVDDNGMLQRYSDCYVLHHFDETKHAEKEQRNYEILLAEYERDGEETDTRTVHYLGKSSMGLAMSKECPIEDRRPLLEQAIHMFRNHIQRSGWDEEIYFSYTYSGLAMTYLDDYESAAKAFVAATLIKPSWADAYWYLCMAALDQKEYHKAVEWGEIASQKQVPDTALAINPSLYYVQGPGYLAQAYMLTGKTREAVAVARKLQDGTERTKKLLKLTEDAHELEDYVLSANKVISYTLKYDKNNISKLVENLPDYLMGDIRIQEARMMLTKPKKWGPKTIAFYCGRSPEEWADPSVLTGIGGSEEATIYLSREFVKLGYEVTIYNNCGKLKGTYQGVTYKPYWDFNPRDTFEWLIIWRTPLLSALVPNAKKVWVWLHDRPFDDWFTPETINRVDKFVFLSKYQRDCAPSIPDEKVLLSQNGLYMADIEKALGSTPRNPYQVIYASSYDRGLDHLLGVWPKIKAAVPEATLKIFYGWNSFDKMRGQDPVAQQFKAKVEQMMQQDGVTHVGRVNQKQLAREMAASSLWVYPTAFWEISCITAMRAQVTGAIPVCTDFAALDETVQHGVKVPGVTEFEIVPEEVTEKIADEVIALLKDPVRQDDIRQKMLVWAKEHFDWARVAKQWSES